MYRFSLRKERRRVFVVVLNGATAMMFDLEEEEIHLISGELWYAFAWKFD